MPELRSPVGSFFVTHAEYKHKSASRSYGRGLATSVRPTALREGQAVDEGGVGHRWLHRVGAQCADQLLFVFG